MDYSREKSFKKKKNKIKRIMLSTKLSLSLSLQVVLCIPFFFKTWSKSWSIFYMSITLFLGCNTLQGVYPKKSKSLPAILKILI